MMEEKESKYNIFRTDSVVGTDSSKTVELILPNERHFLKQSYLNAVRGLLYFRSSLLDTSQARLLPFHTIYSW